MRPILVYTKRKKELKKKKEGNKMGKETERQTDIQTYCPIVEFVFMLFWSQNLGFALGEVSTIIGLRASCKNPQFCLQLTFKKMNSGSHEDYESFPFAM